MKYFNSNNYTKKQNLTLYGRDTNLPDKIGNRESINLLEVGKRHCLSSSPTPLCSEQPALPIPTLV